MPMSLAASLGTTLTLFSAPAFLLANNLLEKQGADQSRHLCDYADRRGAGRCSASYTCLSASWLLPRRGGQTEETDYLRLDRYYTELIVEAESPWIDKPLTEFQAALPEASADHRVAAQRHPPSQYRGGCDADAGDVLIVRASPDEIASMQEEPGLQLHAIAKYGDVARRRTRESASKSRSWCRWSSRRKSPYIGRTIGRIDFLRTLGVVVVGLWRKEGLAARGDLADPPARRRLARAPRRAAGVSPSSLRIMAF